MSVNAFIDTNILIYAHVSSDINKHEATLILMQNLLVDSVIFVSTQVLGEFYTAMVKYKRSHIEISHFISEIVRESNVTDITLNIVESALHIKDKYRYSYWDTLIIAAALASNCTALYSEDMQHNQLIENQLTIINPYA